jgi:hypothetical protein
MHRFLPLLLVVMIIMCSCMAFAQRNANVGIFAGTAYYMGDVNPNQHFYNPTLSLGMIYRYNLNKRYALLGNAYYAKLSGSDLDFPEILHPDRPYSPALFNTSLIDLGLQVEFNFLPFVPNVGKWEYTPYISTGVAGALVLNSDASSVNHLSFPFGIGLKLNLTSRISTGFEWSFRKTFNDMIDGVENPSGSLSIIHNNDWYSFLGVFITFKFFNFAEVCPAYE